MPLNDRAEYDPEPGRPWGPWLLKAGIVGLLAVSLATGSVNLLVPRVSSQLRTGWYLRSNQWRADVRTAVAIVRFVLERGPGMRLKLAESPTSATNSLAIDISRSNAPTALPAA